MPYVIAEPSIGQKDASCVEVCPVDCGLSLMTDTAPSPDHVRAIALPRRAIMPGARRLGAPTGGKAA